MQYAILCTVHQNTEFEDSVSKDRYRVHIRGNLLSHTHTHVKEARYCKKDSRKDGNEETG